MIRICRAIAPLLSVAALAACSGNNTASAPGAPSPSPTPSASVTAVVVTSGSVSGSTVQLTATARLSDGTTRDVTTVSTWSSSDPSVATVSSTGVATVVGSGSVELRAAYQNVLGRMTMDLSGGFEVSGRAQEVGPASSALGSVRVAIVRGAGVGTAVTSDASGAFHFDRVRGVVDIEASKPGYMPWRVSNFTVDHDTTLDVTLYPTPPTNASGRTATARCEDGSWSWSTTVVDACTGHGGIMYGVCPGALCTAVLR